MNTASDERWMNVLQNIEPKYFEWKYVLENGPKIKPKLTHATGPNWILRLEESFPEYTGSYLNGDPYHSSGLDSKVEWATNTLHTWPNVRRTAWDQWIFTNKRDAEKFITLFHLTWAK